MAQQTRFTDDELCRLADLAPKFRAVEGVQKKEIELFPTLEKDYGTETETMVTLRESSHVAPVSRTRTVLEPVFRTVATNDGSGVSRECVGEQEKEITETIGTEKVITDAWAEIVLDDPSAITDIRRVVENAGFDADAAIECVEIDVDERVATYEVRPVADVKAKIEN